ncbi:MAG: carboxypeptidase-like regulatory domain-containing protein [Saprospiraceae bacterium]|nr:carboxypeptidase-like regulatory domain-containing protein [Saprospiraceae bacterium]
MSCIPIYGIQNWSQSFTGNVLDRQNKAFYGAVIYWLGSTAGTTSSENGYFKIKRTPENKKISFYPMLDLKQTQ